MTSLSTNLSVAYGSREVLHSVQIDLQQGEILGLVGASGSGKSTLALALMGLSNYRGARAAGQLVYQGENLLERSEREWRALRGREIALVLQNAASALNPVLSLERQLREAWKVHSKVAWDDARPWVHSLLEGVQLPSDHGFLRRLPREISIGQAQRVLIAMALLHRPSILIADEPTSALDPITQRDVLDLLVQVNREYGVSVVCISHDLLALASICNRVSILHEGSIVETGEPAEMFVNPQHAYTQRLVDSLPRRIPARREDRSVSLQWANEHLA